MSDWLTLARTFSWNCQTRTWTIVTLVDSGVAVSILWIINPWSTINQWLTWTHHHLVCWESINFNLRVSRYQCDTYFTSCTGHFWSLLCSHQQSDIINDFIKHLSDCCLRLIPCRFLLITWCHIPPSVAASWPYHSLSLQFFACCLSLLLLAYVDGSISKIVNNWQMNVPTKVPIRLFLIAH